MKTVTMKVLRIPLVIILLVVAGRTFNARAQTETNLHSFVDSPNDGANPYADVVQGSDGNFYGTTVVGGKHGAGTVFRINPGGTYTNLYSFGSSPTDGSNPQSGLVQGSDGYFYGTTANGGANYDGTVFRISTSGTYTSLYSFGSTRTDGEVPVAGLVQGSDGNFYGTTLEGGTQNNNIFGGFGNGTVFRVSPSGSETNLYSFGSQPNDGVNPNGGLVQGSDGNFYGTTYYGGTNINCASGCGTVFQISPSGIYTSLYSFGSTPNDAFQPQAGLVQGSDGNFYGTTANGGSYNSGAVFRISPSGTETTLYSFAGSPDGSLPLAGLVQGSDGNFYGTTWQGGTTPTGGTYNVGTVFRISPSGTETTLYSFAGSPDGSLPLAGLVQGGDGNFYGTTASGGTQGDGTVFKLYNPPVASFSGSPTTGFAPLFVAFTDVSTSTGTITNRFWNFGDGATSNTTATTVAHVYGTAGTYTVTLIVSGSNGVGTNTQPNYLSIAACTGPAEFNVTGGGSYCLGEPGVAVGLDGSQTGVIYQLYNGASPAGSAVAGTGGSISFGNQTAVGAYTVVGSNTTTACTQAMTGTATVTIITYIVSTSSAPAGGGYTSGGGTVPCGTESNMTVCATASPFYNFVNWTENGNVVGTTACYTFMFMATNDEALVANFAPIIPPQALTNLYSFSGGGGCHPSGSLVQGSNGYFYGTTSGGGAYSNGTVFQIGTSGSEMTFHSFLGSPADGASPDGGLVQGSNGYFYGTTAAGGTYSNGTVFRINTSGTYSNLCSFGNSPDGKQPVARLVLGSDGNFYGTTSAGGTYSNGTVFRISATGSKTNLCSFGISPDGKQPVAGLVQGTDGNFYGTTYAGGTYGVGTVFRVSTNGSKMTLYSFGSSPTDGAYPEAGLVQGSDSNFYGTTYGGGTNGNYGTVFRISPSGSYSNLYSFANSPDGKWPEAALIQGSDGNFYGTTFEGGSEVNCGNGCGTVFRMRSAGTLTWLLQFGISTDDGVLPSGLVQASDGNFYGTTTSGGLSGCGTVFKLSIPPEVSFTASPTNGVAPLTVTFTDASTATGTITNRFWGFGDGGQTNVVTNTVVYTYSTAGVYSVTEIVSGTDGVSTNTQPNCIVAFCLPPTAFSVIGGGSYCSGGTGVGVGLNGSQPNVNYQLELNGSPVSSAVAGTGSSINFGNQTAAGTYTVVGSNTTTGCAQMMNGSTAVSVNSIPPQTITAPSSVCAGAAGNTASVPTTSGATYDWTITGGTITAGQTASTVTFMAGPSGSVTLNCVVISSSGCASAGGQNTSVTINAVPSSTITAPSSVCASSTGNTASVPTTSGATYNWTITGGTITAGQTGSTVTFTAGASGNVVLNCTVTSAGCGSGGSQNTTVAINAAPVAPTTSAGTSVTSSGFTANWGAATGATGYDLDVAMNNGFTGFVTGYNNLNVGNVTSYPVTGLNGGTPYYYRVRAYNLCGTSGNSSTQTVTTASTNSWINAGNGKWEMAGNWSLGTAPSASDFADLITNAGNKAVTIDAATVLSNAVNGCLTISNLYIAGTANSTNTLSLTNAGSATPLQVLGTVGLTLDTNGALVVNNSAIVATNVSGQFIVGNTGGGSSLTISNGGTVYDYAGFLGNNSSSSNNTVLVSGTGSAWSNSAALDVGYSGSGNRLTIANGSAVFVSFGSIGYSGGANSNAVTVTDSGSVWNNSGQLYVGGLAGSGNTLTITNGGAMVDTGYGLIGYNANSNAVTVTGAGSVWNNNSGTLDVGYSSSGNGLTIANGGAVSNTYGYIGCNTGANSNAITVTGAGSVWNNSGGALNVGYSSSGNSLTIANGGAVSNTYGYIGYNTGANSNAVTVTGAGSVWNNNDGTLTVGYFGSGDTLTITNGGAVLDVVGYLGYEPGTPNNAGTVTGPGSVWNNSSYLTVGMSSSGNTLTIANGGAVSNGYFGYIGYEPGANSNAVIVTGTGSVWNNNGFALFVGYYGSSNTLTIANGGAVTVGGTLVISALAGSSNNLLTINLGQLTVASGAINVGANGPGILNLSGGTVAANQLVLTNGANSVFAFNAGTLTSGGTQVTNSQVFAVGDGTDAATFQLVSGSVHSFANNLVISDNATLTGCGTINGNVVVDSGGTVLANCSTLTFTGILTNNGTMVATNGSMLEAYGPVVNNGTIDYSNGSAIFHGTFINNGVVCPATMTTSSSPANGGVTSGGGMADCGSNATVCATANPGYLFANWTLNSSVVSTSTCYTFTPSGNVSLVANFAPFRISALTIQGSNVLVTWIAPEGSTNVVQAANGGPGGGYSTNFLPVSPLIVLPGANSAIGFSTNYLDIGGATNKPARYYRVCETTNGLPTPPSGMVLIPAGTFTMGDALDGHSDAIPTNISVSAFFMDENLVSYSQWQAVYNWAISKGYGILNNGGAVGANYPVTWVNWYDAVMWCNARSQMAGLAPVYYTDPGFTQVLTNGYSEAVYPNWTATGYRLPTEAEWEYAARGGQSGLRFPWGNTISESQANYFGCMGCGWNYDLGPNSWNAAFTNGWARGVGLYTSPVGYFAANGYGLYDMAGNLTEWCWDWYGTPYGQPTTNNPTGPASGSARVLRGGSWNDQAPSLRCANRFSAGTGDFSNYNGFRCVIGPN